MMVAEIDRERESKETTEIGLRMVATAESDRNNIR